MPRTRASRSFRSATALGVLAAGLALPAAASAEPDPDQSPLVTPRFQQAAKADAGHGAVVSVLRGAFRGDTRQQIAAVSDSGLDAEQQPTAAAVALFDKTPTGFDRTRDAQLVLDQPIAAVAGELESDGGTSAVVIGRSGPGYTLESVDWHGDERHRVATLPAQPVSLVVGRFLPGLGSLVAVSLADGRIAFYAPEANGFELVHVDEVPAGPLAVAARTVGQGDALMTRVGNAGARIEFDAVDATWTQRESGRIAHPFGLSGGDIASSEDPYGSRWYTAYAGGTWRLSWFNHGLGEATGYLASAARLGAPVVMNLYGGPDQDVVAALDGDRFQAFEVASGRSTETGLTSGRLATALDVDADRRDDLVVASGTGVTLYHNDTGTNENRPQLQAQALVPSMYDAVTARQVVTSKTFDFVVPKDTGDRYQCQIDDGEWVDCVGDGPGVRGLSVPEDGAYKLHVRRMVAGTEFWSAEQSIGFRVKAQVTAKPTLVEQPATVANGARYRITPPAGTRVEYRVDLDDCWSPTAINPDGSIYLDLTSDLADAQHKITFRAVDAVSGVPSETVVSEFLLDKTRPLAPTKISGPQAQSTARTATFAFEGEPNGSYECRIDQQNPPRGGAARTIDPWEPCTSPWTVKDLTLGEHVVEVRQTDAAGNRGRIATWTWTVVAPTPDVVENPTPVGPTKETVVPPVAETPAPAPTPAAPAATPTPAPAAPAAPKPIDAKIEVGAPAAKGQTPVATATGRRVAVGCAAPGATDYRCTVTVTRGGKTVGQGRRTGSGVVPVDLDKATARKVQRLGGLKVRVTLTVKTEDGRTSKTQKTVRVLPRKVLVVPTDGLFAFDSATPSRKADALAKQIARQLDGARTITIVGHTDAKGAADVNRRLGQQRAEAFRRLLAKHGFGGKVAVESAGDTQPRTSNDTENGRALNRRVEIDVRY